MGKICSIIACKRGISAQAELSLYEEEDLMSEIFLEKNRGGIVESLHRGDAVVVDSSGKVVAQAGDAQKYTYFRSSAKPIQALNVVLSGAYQQYGLTLAELAVICSSHYSEDYHLAAVRSILAKAGLDETYLRCGAAKSIREEIAYAQALQGIGPARIKSDCSGKHSGMLITCKHKGYPLESYLEPTHPLQQEILGLVAELCCYPKEQIGIGVDGCGVPVFALPIYNMALGFARLADSALLQTPLREASDTVFAAMNAAPEMVSGTGGYCSTLMKATGGRMIGKIGAQGVYCIGIKDKKLGIALKIEDGSAGTASVAAMHVLRELDLLSEAEYVELEAFHHPAILNDEHKIVGETRAVFRLQQ
jgi:L-asparaginase II